jgi:tRNA(adenine34) deaminase
VDDAFYMRLALAQASRAQAQDEVPVGAVVVSAEGELIGQGANAVIGLSDPSAHAEVMALREAASYLGNYRLPGASVFVTLEPCAMCLGAMFHARVARIVYGASDLKTGACGGCVDLTVRGKLNHHAHIEGGLLSHECGQLLSQFFKARRGRNDSSQVSEVSFPAQNPD